MLNSNKGIEDADLILHSPLLGYNMDFGERVAPLYDITGDGFPEIRVRSQGHPDGFFDGFTITHIFNAAGDPLFFLITNEQFDPWQELPGDVIGDAAVHEGDLDIVLANLGMEGDDLTRRDGDLNGDGVVDALDMLIVMDNLGSRLLTVSFESFEQFEPMVHGPDGHGERNPHGRARSHLIPRSLDPKHIAASNPTGCRLARPREAGESCAGVCSNLKSRWVRSPSVPAFHSPPRRVRPDHRRGMKRSLEVRQVRANMSRHRRRTRRGSMPRGPCS